MNIRGVLALLILGLVSSAAGYGAYRWWQAAHAPMVTAELRPDLPFQGLDGQIHKLSEWNGKLLLLNFWATWCTPCLKEIPLLVETQARLATRNFQIVGIAMDQAEPVRRYAERLKMNYPIMAGEADVVTAMDALGDTLGALPFSVLISPDGRILERISGDLSREELEALLIEHL